VILATVHGNDAELARALDTGVVTHLPKPFELDRLVRTATTLADELERLEVGA
jgi:CheY-like chemotaxis protein